MRFFHARRSLHLAAAFVLLASQLVFLVPSTAMAAPGVVVNSTGDAGDTLPGDGLCLTGGTNSESALECTFRAALQEANASVSITEVTFDIPASDPGLSGGIYIISPATVYPDIGSSILVDGSTQTGFTDTPIVVLDGSGAADIASGTDGLLIAGNSVTVRGLGVRDFPDDGIEIHGDNNHIYGNHVTGNDAGILIESGNNNTIGSSNAADRNYIFSNDWHGVAIDSSTGSQVRGNVIGLDDGGSASGNGGHGLYVWNSSNETLVVDNLIVASGGDGVALGSGVDNRAAVFGNSIYANGGLGIDLGDDGHSGNDPGDPDSGPNGYLNYPVVESAEAIGTDTQVEFSLDTPDGWYRVDFYLNPGGADASGYGEGQIPSSTTVVQKTGTALSLTHSITASVGDVVTSTATRCGGPSCGSPTATSEYSAATTVVPANLPPQLGAISNVSIDEGDDVAFTVTATDPDPGDSLTFDLVGAPAGAAIDPDTGEFTWSTSEDNGPTLFSFDIRVTDDGSPNLSATHTMEILVGEINEPPTITDPGDQVVDELTTLSLTVLATDPDQPANSLSFTLDGAPPGASIDSGTATFEWTPDETQGPGSYTFDIVVDDGGTPLFEDRVTVTVEVVETNQTPSVVSPGDQASAEGDSVSLTVAATDDDVPSDTLTYDATGLPPGLSIDTDSGEISGTVTYSASVGSPYTTVLTVSDDGSPSLFDTVSFSWAVADANRAPVLSNIPNAFIPEKTLITFVATAIDPDSDGVTFDLVGEPPGASIDPLSGEFRWIPTESQGPASYVFEVIVEDSGSPTLSDAQTVLIVVSETNRSPSLNAPGNFTVNEQTLLTFDASASDPDLPANTLTFSLVGAPAGASIGSGGHFVWTPTEAQGPNIYTFTVRVADNGNLVDTEQVTVTVNETHRPPLVVNPGSQTTPEGQTVALHVTAFDPDLPANVLTYSANGLPQGLSIDPGTGNITGTVDYYGAATSPHTTTITVTDNTGLKGTVTFTWTTPNTNRPPNLDLIPNRTFDEETTVIFMVNAADPDVGTKLTYRMTGAPAGASIDPVTGVFTWSTNESHGPGSYSPTVTVIDDDTHAPLGDSQTFTITIDETNKPPVAVDDSATTAEDTPVRIDLLGNDSDEDHPADVLLVRSVDRSVAGGRAEIEGGGTILYHPRADYHGLASFTYTLSDGQATTTGSVTVVVTPVNDRPVAVDDRYRLSSYQPVELPILLNDIDADGEKLTFALTSLPSVGSLRIEDDLVVYDPENGWTGSVRFGYEVYDAEGASSRASVDILVGAEVLVGAQELASELGVDVVPFEPPAPNFDAATLSLIDLDGITLLADSFFQTVGALRIPLGFLGVTVVMIVGFGATSEVPALVFGARRKHWSVVRLGRQQRLPAYSDPGGRKAVYNYDPTASGIVSTGKIRLVGANEWVPVDTPNGPGWIYRKYLTEQVDIRAFINDPRPVKLIHELADRLRSGQSIDSLVSDRGLLVALTGSPNQIAPNELAALMGDKRLRNLPGAGSGLQTPEDFAVAVAEPFLEAYDSTPEVTGEVPHSKSALIPTECWNYPYVAIGSGPVQPWLVFFEYKNGKPVITGLGIDE